MTLRRGAAAGRDVVRRGGWPRCLLLAALAGSGSVTLPLGACAVPDYTFASAEAESALATCSDGVLSLGESGVDCGGPCGPCLPGGTGGGAAVGGSTSSGGSNTSTGGATTGIGGDTATGGVDPGGTGGAETGGAETGGTATGGAATGGTAPTCAGSPVLIDTFDSAADWLARLTTPAHLPVKVVGLGSNLESEQQLFLATESQLAVLELPTPPLAESCRLQLRICQDDLPASVVWLGMNDGVWREVPLTRYATSLAKCPTWQTVDAPFADFGVDRAAVTSVRLRFEASSTNLRFRLEDARALP